MRFLSSITCTVVLIISTSPAYAGAWTQDAGSTQVIITGSYFNNEGKRQSQPAYDKYEIDPYVEYGLWDGITAGGELSLERAHQNASASAVSQTSYGLGDSEFFLRTRLWQGNGFVISAQPMVMLPSPEHSSTLPRLGESHPDAGMSLSVGYGFSAWGLDHFADIDTEYRYRFGSPKDQIRISGTLGMSVTPRWMIMPQLFQTYRASTPSVVTFTQSSADDYNLTQVQLSVIYKIREDVWLQAAGFSDISGRNTGAGNGGLIGLWEHF